MSSRRNPFQGLEELFERMSRQFENAARAWDVDVDSGGRLDFGGGEMATGLDMTDHDDEFVITVDVPGYEKSDIDVRLSGDTLRISGERERTIDEDDESYIRRERRSRSFDRQVRLPEPVDPEGADGQVNNGVLTITLPKRTPSSEGHSISIE